MDLFGTTGIRKIFSPFDKGTESFTPIMAYKIGLAIGTYSDSGSVVVGRDCRVAAVPIELALCSGLVSSGCTVKTIGIVTTPTLSISVQLLDCDIGIMITASHNTPEYIGIKLWNKNGLGFDHEQEEIIENIYDSEKFKKITWKEIGSITEIHDINKMHVNWIFEKLAINGNHKNSVKRNISVIVDPGNGSACEIAPMLLNKLGCKFITLNSQPDGSFPGRLSEPNSKNLRMLSTFVQASKDVEMGIALDGDADRVVFIDGEGNLIEPIRFLTFIAKEYLRLYPPKSFEKPRLFTPINSSRVIDFVLDKLDVKVNRTAVGDVNVAQELARNGGFLGGENAGTFIWPKFHLGPDSLLTISLLILILQKSEKTFTELINEIPIFPYLNSKHQLKSDSDFHKSQYEIIRQKMVQRLNEKGYKSISVSDLDGLHFNFEDGWVLIRKSGTSPIIRVEAESNSTKEKAKEILNMAESVLFEIYEFGEMKE